MFIPVGKWCAAIAEKNIYPTAWLGPAVVILVLSSVCYSIQFWCWKKLIYCRQACAGPDPNTIRTRDKDVNAYDNRSDFGLLRANFRRSSSDNRHKCHVGFGIFSHHQKPEKNHLMAMAMDCENNYGFGFELFIMWLFYLRLAARSPSVGWWKCLPRFIIGFSSLDCACF